MDNVNIGADRVVPLLETPFINVYDLQYAPGKHYYDATRRKKDDLVCVKTDQEFKSMTADAVSCFVILRSEGAEPRLLLSYEYRYPCGQYLLSVPAGLIDPEDRGSDRPALRAAAREIREETGITLGEGDTLTLVNPAVFSTPGMTDESNALACAVVTLKDPGELTQSGAVGSERFDGFAMLTAEEARGILSSGTDEKGRYNSVYTWCALMWFVSGMWKA